MSSRLDARATHTSHITLDAPDLLPILLIASLTEAILLRLLLRLGPVLPQTPFVSQLADAGRLIATTALNLAYLLTICVLLLIAWRAFQSARWLGIAMIVALSIELVNALGFNSAYATLAFHVLVFFMMLAALWLTHPSRWLALGLILVFAATEFATYTKLVNVFAFPGFTAIPALAETCAVLAVIPFAIAWRGESKRAWLAMFVALIAAASFLAMTTFVAWLPPLLAVWDFSFTLFLPDGVYALALWLFAYAILSGWHSHRLAVIGLLLIAFGGLRPDYAYAQHLNWVGFLLVAGIVKHDA